MKLLDKIKNMFTEEVEDDDVKVEQIKQDVTHVSIESPTAEKIDESKEEELIENFTNNLKEPKPVFFNDDDFKDLNLFDEPREEKKEIQKEPKKEREIYNSRLDDFELYGSKVKEEKATVEEKKIFKPTPIISPVYGVLDKNYHKEDIVSRDEALAERKEESPIDTIRNKAYGTLEDELENTLFGSNSILFKKEEPKEEVEIKEVDDDILTDLTDDISKELDELLIKKEKYIDEDESKSKEKLKHEKKETIEKKEDLPEDEDLLGFIDSTLYKDGDE